MSPVKVLRRMSGILEMKVEFCLQEKVRFGQGKGMGGVHGLSSTEEIVKRASRSVGFVRSALKTTRSMPM